MVKLEVGMYCYNKTNRKLGIGKIIGFQTNDNVVIKYKSDIGLASAGNLVASHNLIDLIEEGDYVNGYKVDNIEFDYSENVSPKRTFVDVDINDNMGFRPTYFKNIEIKSIATREQFKSMQYEVQNDS